MISVLVALLPDSPVNMAIRPPKLRLELYVYYVAMLRGFHGGDVTNRGHLGCDTTLHGVTTHKTSISTMLLFPNIYLDLTITLNKMAVARQTASALGTSQINLIQVHIAWFFTTVFSSIPCGTCSCGLWQIWRRDSSHM
jgi:hypothetical protein